MKVNVHVYSNAFHKYGYHHSAIYDVMAVTITASRIVESNKRLIRTLRLCLATI
jgi:hypothetical protein